MTCPIVLRSGQLLFRAIRKEGQKNEGQKDGA